MATAEVINFKQPVVSAPPESCMICTEDLWKTYDMGSEQQVHALRENYGIYMADSGRFNVVGMSDSQVDRFVSAIAECIDG